MPLRCSYVTHRYCRLSPTGVHVGYHHSHRSLHPLPQPEKLFSEDNAGALNEFLAEDSLEDDEIVGMGDVRRVRFAASRSGTQGGR